MALVRTLLRRLAENRLLVRIETTTRHRLVPMPVAHEGVGVLLITTYGCGNVGDQAMFESFLRNTDCKVKAIVSRADAFQVPEDLADRVEMVVLDGLFQGRPQVSFLPTRRFLDLLSSSEALVIIGADILDGGYNYREALSRVEALRLATRLDIPGRVVGFSWSAQPDPDITRRLRDLSRSVDLFARDPASLERLKNAGIAAYLAPDTVFALTPPSTREQVATLKTRLSQELAGPYVLLNVSGLLRKRGVKAEQYLAMVRELESLGYQIVLLPHVFREGDDDLAACREVQSLAGDNHVHLIESPVDPSDVQALASEAAMVITGRMHLGILGLTVGAPPIIFSSQGKVEGMLGLFGLEHHAVAPSCGMAADTVALIRIIAASEAQIRAAILERLPEVAANSAANFSWQAVANRKKSIR